MEIMAKVSVVIPLYNKAKYYIEGNGSALCERMNFSESLQA
jgi:cellulose synthase/poly-beta-1,6-N-acetylglucosamine synthase-like glycosyltransferase